ncbi:NADH-quinone oxidoreductase subunit I [Pengzhenrongella phosphoraccumulans]|uniref:NADH-quinone oxidoreductase subunit I n=1 Tax=Pengzhenrongella phosphoraccumulans TaxID=3114394 RepID=UPI00388FB514
MITTSSLGGLQRWLSHQAGDVLVELVCAEHPDPSAGAPERTVVRLPGCASEVAPHELLELLLLGAARVVVRVDGCARSDDVRAHLAPTLALLAAGLVDRLTVDAGPEPEQAVPTDLPRRGRRSRRERRRPVLDAAAMPVSRRGLLGLERATVHELPALSDDPHDRLVAVVRALVAPTAALADVPAPALRLAASGCTACGVCVQACPAGALVLRHGPGGEQVSISTLLHDPAACNGCTRCIDLCPEHVLVSAGRWAWDRLLVDAEIPVVTVTTALCARCSTSFPVSSGERLCPVCTFRRHHPFGSTLPPGVGPADVLG